MWYKNITSATKVTFRSDFEQKNTPRTHVRAIVCLYQILGRNRKLNPLTTIIVCFLFVSLLSHFWLIHLFYLHLTYQLYVGLCQATRVQSHQRQSTSAVAIATCEVQVSAADYQTVPTVATGVSKPLCCRLTLTFTLTSENLSLYITLLL